MQLDLNFTLKNPDGTEVNPAEPISAKSIVTNFLISPSSHQSIDTERAWDFAIQVATMGIIETDSKGLKDFWHDFEKSPGFPILTKGNIKEAIDKARSKTSRSEVSQDECESECKDN